MIQGNSHAKVTVCQFDWITEIDIITIIFKRKKSNTVVICKAVTSILCIYRVHLA